MSLREFGKIAISLARNPLSIIALFLVLIYACTALYMGISGSQLAPEERIILIWFLVIFPVAVLGVFVFLVSKHSEKLYAPTDFSNDHYYLLSQQKEKSEVIKIDGGEQVQAEQQIDESKKKAIEELKKFGEGLLSIPGQEELIKKELSDRGLETTGESIAILIRHLATTQFLFWFEKTYRLIFGSQIFLLRKINQEISKSIKKEAVGMFFEEIQKSIEELSAWTLNQYLFFMMNEGLLIEEDDKLLITLKGNDFLTIMTRLGYSEKRGAL
jgi:hypothetical protein